MQNKQITQSNGLSMSPQSFEEGLKMAGFLAQSQIVPKSFQGKQGDVMVAMMLGVEIGLNPIQSLQNIAVINGRPCVWGDALLALAQKHPAFDGIVETFNDETMTATCTIKRKGMPPHSQNFSLKDADSAGLSKKPGPWQQYPKRMLALRARGFALRNSFADALLGLVSREEAEDMPIDITPENHDINETHSQAVLTQPDYYPDDKFDENFDKWKNIIDSGKKTAQDIIKTIESKQLLTDQQKETLLSLEKA